MVDSKDNLKDKTCFFTGHRDIPLEKMPHIQKELEETVISLIERGIIYYGVGGALGFDTIAALTVIKLKAQYPQLRLVMILPCRNHHFSWQGKDIRVFEGIQAQADKVIYTADRYYNGCMYKRNRHMAEGSGYCVCYMARPTGGTAYTVNYARSMGVEIINIAE